jgi:hypothetical protein
MLTSRNLKLVLALALITSAVRVSAAPLPKGQRLLGIDVSNSTNATYDQAFQLSQKAGMQFTTLSLAWDSLENPNVTLPGNTVPGSYSNTTWAFADGYYSAYQCKLALMVGPIDTNNLRVPADLTSLAFDDPKVVSRYEQVADYVLAQFPHTSLISFSVGNEVDVYLSNNPAFWTHYTTFYQSVSAYLKLRHPGLQVGVKATFAGLTQTQVSNLQSLNAGSDLILVTYYPENADFTVRNPAGTETDLTNLVNLYPSKPIYLQEVGYQSSTTCASSDALQASFVQHFFNAWDQQANHIIGINYVWLHDQSLAAVDQFSAYYGFWDPRFREYLHTLGLRTYDGQDKPAFTAFKQQVAARGWNTDYTPTTTPTAANTATASPTPTAGSTAMISPTITPGVPVSHRLVTAFPSPGRSQMSFVLSPDQGEEVSLTVYTISGQKAYELDRPAGRPGALVWNCRQAAPGVYLVRIQCHNQPTQYLKVAVIH